MTSVEEPYAKRSRKKFQTNKTVMIGIDDACSLYLVELVD